MSTTETKQLETFKAELGGFWPLAYGLHVVRGNMLAQREYNDATYGEKTRIAFVGLGEGPWDGIDRLWVNLKRVDPTDTALYHFHPGTDGVLGHGLTPDSTGGDQLVDTFWSLMPANMQAVTFDRLAYLALKIPPDPGAPGPDIDVIGHYRGMKVRTFDNAGTETGFAFSTNPAWCILDYIIRRFLKREALVDDALVALEKARINFASFVTAAADCDTVCPDGTKRFELNLGWARQTSSEAILEQMLRSCRGYLQDSLDGKFALYIDKARASTFVATHDHVPAQAVKFTKNIRGQANRLTGAFRDLNVAQMATISSIVRASNVVTVTFSAAHDFKKDDYIDIVGVTDTTFNVTDNKITSLPSSTQVRYSQTAADATSSGGYAGMSEQRFRDASWPCQHGQAALAAGQRGPGLSAIPKWTDLQLDFGNSIYAQVQRVLKYLKTRYLGNDAAPYTAPWGGTVRFHYNAVDASDQILAAQMPGDLITIDRSISEEYQGDYEILVRKVVRPPVGSGGAKMLELELLEYVSAAFIDNPDTSPVMSSPVPRNGLVISGGPGNGSYRPLVDPLTATDAGSNVTINIASFSMRFQGISPDPSQNSGAITGLNYATQYFIYYDDPDRRGGDVSYAATTTKENVLSKSGWLFAGSIVTPNAGGADTVGNGDGGAGAQIGRFFTVLPASYSTVGSWTNPLNGVDTDANTYATVTTVASSAEYKVFDFPAIPGGFGTLLLKIKHEFPVFAGGTGTVDYSLDGGANWTTARSVTTADGSPVTTQVTIGVLQNPELIQARIEVPQSQDTPTDHCGTGADNNAVGTLAWTNPTNAQGAADATYAAASTTTDGTVTHYLKATNYGFAIPGGATIKGITVTAYVAQQNSGVGSIGNEVLDNVVSLLKAGVVTGSNKADGTNSWASVPTRAYGGPTDLWGTTWTPSDINNANFGVVISAVFSLTGGTCVAKIDAVDITVTYDTGAGSTQCRVYRIWLEAQQ